MQALTILHTNDMHGRLDAMARLSAFAKQLRAEAEAEGRTVFFWDAGDAADRRETLFSATKGSAISPILNVMGYDLQTVGNDIPLPYGPQAMEAVAARAQFAILGANFRNRHEPLVTGLVEAVEFPLANGGRLGVFGLTAPWDGLYKVFGLDLPDTYEIAREMVASLRAAGCTLVMVLSHLGLPDDCLLAARVAGIDVIVGAHTHDLLPQGEMVGKVLIAQAGEYAQSLGRIDLTLDDKGRIVQRSVQVLQVPPEQTPDPQMLEAIAAGEREIAVLLAQPIGESRAPLDVNYFDECGVGALAADALCEHMHAEIGLVSSGLFHKGLPQGVITRGDLNATCFATANPYVTTMKGSQVWEILERGLDPAVSEFVYRGFRGPPIGFPQISGMQVGYNPAAATGARIQRITIGGQALDPERLYRLAHTDAENIAEYGYFVIADGQASEGEVPIILGEVIEAYLGRHSPLDAPEMGRWKKG